MLDDVEEIVEEIKRERIHYLDMLEMEYERKSKNVELLRDKIKDIEKIESTIIPDKYKKAEEVFENQEDIKKFYYNLIFFGYISFESGIGFLLEDKENFFLKYKIEQEEFSGFIDFSEELLVTEEKAKEVLDCDIDRVIGFYDDTYFGDIEY